MYVWMFIHAWLLLFILYGFTTICRQSELGYLYQHPPLISPLLYLAFALNQVCCVAVLFLVDRGYLAYSLIFSALGIFSLYMCMFLLQRRMYQHGAELEKVDKVGDIWSVCIFAENGIAFFASWLSLTFLYDIGKVVVYVSENGIKRDIASIIVLVMICGEIGVWFVLDNFVMEKFSRYTVSPYVASIVYMIAIVDNNWRPASMSFIFALCLAGCACLLLIIKLFIMFWRHGTKRFFRDNYADQTWSTEDDLHSLHKKDDVSDDVKY